MPKLPVVKSRDIVKFLNKNGFLHTRTVGSHMRFVNSKKGLYVTIPYKSKPLKRGTLNSILKQANLTTEELIKFLGK